MSRNYYLALPVNRKRLFFIIQCRGMALAVPLMILVAILAFLCRQVTASIVPADVLSHPLYGVLFIYGGMVWLLNMMIEGTLQWERISSYLSIQQRAWEYVRLMLIQLAEMGAMFAAGKFFWANAPVLVLAVVLVVVAFRYGRTRNLWIGV